ncbi:MAG: FtsQ-type POTRA domain-containing protein [Nocardioidaceae bacterium]
MTQSVVDSQTLFGRRRWRWRLTVWRPWLLTAALLLAVALAGWVVLFSSWLAMRSVEVNGAHEVARSDVTTAARITPGTPLARVDLDAVEARVEAIPEIAAATVRRGWPHTIVITVAERQPVATVHRDGSWRLMDKAGVVYDTTAGRDPAEPVVEIDAGPAAEILPQVAQVLGVLPRDLAAQTRRVTASSVDSITLHLRDGTEITWGSAAESAQKATVLRALMRRSAAAYDVSVPSQPAARG